MSHGQNTKTENRSHTVTNSVKTLNMVHIPPLKEASSLPGLYIRGLMLI